MCHLRSVWECVLVESDGVCVCVMEGFSIKERVFVRETVCVN